MILNSASPTAQRTSYKELKKRNPTTVLSIADVCCIPYSSVIETAEDIEPAIDRLIFEGVIRNEEKEEMAREVAQKAFSSPEIQDWYSGEWTLFNECAIIYKEKRSLANSPSRPCNDERRAGSCRRF